MNQNTQARIATVLASLLGIVGLLAIGVAFGLGLAVQMLLNGACQPPSIGVATTNCQVGIKQIVGKPATIAVVGVGALIGSGAMLYYLRRVWP